MQVIPEQAALVREGARRILAGESLYMFCRVWNERGERTATGKPWSERSLTIALRNPATKGVRAYRPLMPDGRRSPTPEVVTRGNWKAILSKKQWTQVNEVLDARRATFTTNPEGGSVKRVHPFTGLIRCARCGNAMRKMGANYICISHQRRRDQRTDRAGGARGVRHHHHRPLVHQPGRHREGGRAARAAISGPRSAGALGRRSL